MTRARKLVVAAVGLGVVFALLGIAHAPLGRPLLEAVGGCPVSLERADPRKVEAFRVARLNENDGEREPRTTAALGFELGKTTRGDVVRSLGAGLASCIWKRRQTVLHCERRGGGALHPASSFEDAHLQFDAAGVLVAADVFHVAAEPERVLSELSALDGALRLRVGPSTRVTGGDTSQALSRRFGRHAREYRYRNYVAVVSATQLGSRGLRLREQYQWAAEDAG